MFTRTSVGVTGLKTRDWHNKVDFFFLLSWYASPNSPLEPGKQNEHVRGREPAAILPRKLGPVQEGKVPPPEALWRNDTGQLFVPPPFSLHLFKPLRFSEHKQWNIYFPSK